eukprot:gene15491-17070_t
MEAKPVDMIRLKSLEIKLKERSKKLKEFDAEILDMISEDETLDAYCGEEIEETGRFKERITIALLSIDEVKSEVEKPKLTRSNSEISIDSLSSKNALVVKFIAKSRKQTTETSVTASETAAAEKLWIKSAQCNLVKEEGHKQLKQQLGLFEDEEVLKCRGGLEN